MEEIVDNLCMIPEAGKDLVTIAPTRLFHIPAADQTVVRRLREACARVGSTFYFTVILSRTLNDLLIFGSANSCAI